MNSHLSDEQLKELFNLFEDYKKDKKLSTQKIADKLRLDRTTVGKNFKKMFGNEYTEISKIKSRFLKKKHTPEQKLKVSQALKGKPKPPRSLQHRINLSKAMSRSYIERFGEEKARIIKEKIGKSHLGKKRLFKNKELWRINLSNSLKGRVVWNKGKKGLTKAWNKKELPTNEIIDSYSNKNLSSSKIAKRFNVSKHTILRILKKERVRLKGLKDFIKNKTLEEIHGEERAKIIKEKLSKSLKGKPVKNWARKIKAGLIRYHEKCRFNNIKIIRQGKPWPKEARLKRSINHRKYLREHPEELERLRKIQYPGGISKIEQKMLNFLRQNFKENEDFYFDKQDLTGKTFYRPDFQFPKQNIIIEVDGHYRHFTKEGYRKDKIREYYLKKAGWKVYRFNFYDIDREYKFKDIKTKIIGIFGEQKC